MTYCPSISLSVCCPLFHRPFFSLCGVLLSDCDTSYCLTHKILAILTLPEQLAVKMGHPRRPFRLFLSIQTNITIFTTNICEKCTSSIWCWDSNPQPSKHESPPMTIRPGLLSYLNNLLPKIYLSLLFLHLTVLEFVGHVSA